MYVFFDTEFSQFREGQLLSIGLVTDDDRKLYLEIHDHARWDASSDFCKTVVLPQFTLEPSHVAKNDREAGLAIATWLRSLDSHLTLAYDYKLDWRFFESCLVAAGEWQTLQPLVTPLNVADFANSERCLKAQEDYFLTQAAPGRHHALVDAYALRERWREHQRND